MASPWVAGVKVEENKRKGYETRMGSRGEVELKKEKIVFFLKIYEDQLGSKSEQQPFPGNCFRKLFGYFNDTN